MSEQTKFEKKSFQEAEADGIIEGRNAVIEALRSETAIDKIYLAKGETDKTLGHIASKARAAGIVVVEADRRKLDNMSRTHAHQGVIALAAVREYATVEDILAAAAERNEAPLLVICDEISDPHNLGAIIRTAAASGYNFVYMTDECADAYSNKAVRSSMTGVLRVNVMRAPVEKLLEVINLPIWVADMNGQDVQSVKTEGALCLVIGNEGKGVSKTVREKANFTVSIPMENGVESLNAAVSAGILMYGLKNKA